MMISCWHPERLDRPSFPSVCSSGRGGQLTAAVERGGQPVPSSRQSPRSSSRDWGFPLP
ncbi:hypothetical protein GBAR_LOCUS20479 [Geodia barretti]|uniref:Uncharacterized protein n=1 Tax=Geodia barretti TaxID=519541 RepID=A0AA35X3J6_GEOBA|nr:hypothetical protein GBAR_LOCUS20479 [Geodia barretti]